MFLCGNLEVSE